MAPEARRAVARGRAPEGRRGDEPEIEAPRSWGGVARRGARVVGEERPATASAAWREAVARGRKDAEHGPRSAPPAWEPEVWIEDDDVEAVSGARPAARPRATTRERARAAGTPAEDAPSRRRKLPDDVTNELNRSVGAGRSPRVEAALAEAARAYERDRYLDARRMLRPLVQRYPDVAAVRELHGLTLYRIGKWPDAIKELDQFRALSDSYDQHPVLMDCHRALGHRRQVDELWEDLRVASPGAEVVTEGRIVMAATIADGGDVRGAIALLERSRTDQKRPKFHHLRVWYALADLYERAGDIPRARELFRAVLAHDREFADVAERLAALA